MEKTKYRSYIQKTFKEYASHKPAYGEVEVELILILNATIIRLYMQVGIRIAAYMVVSST